MIIETLKNLMPDFATDTKLNLGTILNEEGSELTQRQIYLVALATAFAIKNPALKQALTAEINDKLTAPDIQAAKAAATIMAMNNVYYRFVHLSQDKSFASLPAKLRMNVIGKPGIEKLDFELMCLAVSALNGCGMCIDAHVNELKKAGLTSVGIQSSIRIAAVLNAAAMALEI